MCGHKTLHPESNPGEVYMIDVDTVNGGIPYADSFYVVLHFCISKVRHDDTKRFFVGGSMLYYLSRQVSPRESRLSVYAAIKYKKNVWGIVKSETIISA